MVMLAACLSLACVAELPPGRADCLGLSCQLDSPSVGVLLFDGSASYIYEFKHEGFKFIAKQPGRATSFGNDGPDAYSLGIDMRITGASGEAKPSRGPSFTASSFNGFTAYPTNVQFQSGAMFRVPDGWKIRIADFNKTCRILLEGARSQYRIGIFDGSAIRPGNALPMGWHYDSLSRTSNPARFVLAGEPFFEEGRMQTLLEWVDGARTVKSIFNVRLEPDYSDGESGKSLVSKTACFEGGLALLWVVDSTAYLFTRANPESKWSLHRTVELPL